MLAPRRHPRRSFLSSSHSRPRLLFPFLILGFLSCTCTRAEAKETTYDDTDSSFSWVGEFTAVSGDCGSCATKLDSAQVHGGTWHDENVSKGNTARTGGSFTFTGTGVKLYGVDLAGDEPAVVFTLSPEGTTSTHTYSGSENKVYNALFYSSPELSNGQHTLSWSLQLLSSGKDQQVVMLDYAVVTTPDETSPGGGSSGAGSGGGSQTGDGSDDSSSGGGSSNDGHSDSGGSSSGGGSSSTGSSESDSNNSNNAGEGSSNSSGTSSRDPDPSTSKTSSSKPSGMSASTSKGVDVDGHLSPSRSSSGTTAASNTNVSASSDNTQPQLSSASAHKHTPIGAIIGAAIGGLVLLVLLAVAFCIWRRKRNPSPASKITTFNTREAEEGARDGVDGAMVAATSAYPAEKTRRDLWSAQLLQPQRAARPASLILTSTVSILSPSSTDPTSATSPSETSPLAPSESPPAQHAHTRAISRAISLSPSTSMSFRTTTTMRERERILEARVAELEARIAGVLPSGLHSVDGNDNVQPPPYVAPPRPDPAPAPAPDG